MKSTLASKQKIGQATLAFFLAIAMIGQTGMAQAQSDSTSANMSLIGVALDAADDNRFFTRVGGTVRDDLSYEGLEPGKTYTVASRLFNMTTQAPHGDFYVTTFVPEASSGNISVELPMPQNRTKFNIDYVVLSSVHDGEVSAQYAETADALMKLEGFDDVARTVQSHAIQGISVKASANGGLSLPPEGGVIDAHVEHTNLVAGYAYTVWGQLLTPSGQTTGIYASMPEYIPDDKNGSLDLKFDVPAGWDGIKLVPTVGLYHKKRVELNSDGSLTWIKDAVVPVMIASDTSVDDPEQTISVGTPFEDMPEEK